MAQLVTIFGGSGFVGRYIARRMAKAGWRVRVAVRRPNEALFVRPYGAVGQVEPVPANLRDDASVRAALHGAEAAINCVGILAERGKNTFDAIQAEGAGRVARLAAEAGAARMVHVSAIGADPDGASAYARSKADGEARVLETFPHATILRPSIVFGPEDQFFNRFAAMARTGPILPIVGAGTRFQPVHVDDVAQAAVQGALGNAAPGIYELGGPGIHDFRDLMECMLRIIQRRRPIVNVPFRAAAIVAGVLDMAQAASLGLFHNGLLTRDQVLNLRSDNVAGAGTMGFADLGMEPTAMEAVLEDYLWPHRPGGQYAEIRDSAARLRDQE